MECNEFLISDQGLQKHIYLFFGSNRSQPFSRSIASLLRSTCNRIAFVLCHSGLWRNAYLGCHSSAQIFSQIQSKRIYIFEMDRCLSSSCYVGTVYDIGYVLTPDNYVVFRYWRTNRGLIFRSSAVSVLREIWRSRTIPPSVWGGKR